MGFAPEPLPRAADDPYRVSVGVFGSGPYRGARFLYGAVDVIDEMRPDPDAGGRWAGWLKRWRSPRGSRDRFVAYFQLYEALGEEGCPVCRCLRRDTFRFLDGLMWEQVNDPDTRETLRAAWGFCNWHAWMLREIHHATLGIAIIYHDLVGRAIDALAATARTLEAPAPVRGLRRLFRRALSLPVLTAWSGRARCPACQGLGAFEQHYLKVLVDYADDPEFARALDRSSGVCLPHLLLAMAAHPEHPGLGPLLNRLVPKARKLRDVLQEYVAKHDYQRKEPFTDEEAHAVERALELFVGRPELFGNQILRTPERHEEPDRAEPLAPAPPEEADGLRRRVEELEFEKGRLELRIKELIGQLGEATSRAAALHYRLWSVSEDRKALELNLSGEQAAGKLWEKTVEELRAEVETLRERLAKYERKGGEALGPPEREP